MHQIRLKSVLWGGKDASVPENRLHQLYLAVFLTLFALANGFLALRLAACSYDALWAPWLYASYFDFPMIVLLNLLPGVLLMALGYFLTRRAWAAYLISALPTVGFALVNYFKIQLRGDPFLASDLRLVSTAGGILGHYSLDITRVVLVAAGSMVLMLLFTIFLMPNGLRFVWVRAGGAIVCLALVPLLYTQVYMNNDIYYSTVNYSAIENEWSQVEVFLSRGFWYPFIRSVSKALPSVPEGYDAGEARELLARYAASDISPEKKVNVACVMLEAFSDLSDFPMLAAQPGVAAIYEPLHELEKRGVSGRLLTNIFAGGTVETEWEFLTGASAHNEFRTDTGSYVRYFSAQGYETLYRHPGYSWFYNRRNINGYLGFDGSMFTEDGFGELVDPEKAPLRSDAILFDYLLRELEARPDGAAPLFQFSVTYQNHGPYDDRNRPVGALTTEDSGWSLSTVSIINNYLAGISDTIAELTRFVDGLEACGKPVVLVVFGDHKPWLGNNASAYSELGVDFTLSEMDGFANYYATPYFIWANRAAKEILGTDFTGEGGDFSPCFLMAEVFDQCGWEGPGFMQLAREMRALTPLVHEQGLFLVDGAITDTLSPDAAEFYREYRCVEYWRERHGAKES